MKAGILTFHNAYNYGAILQAYALQETLIEKGVETKIIDYRLRQIEEEYKILRFDLVRDLIKKKEYVSAAKIIPYNCLNLNSRIKKFNKFKNFSNTYLKLTKKCNTYSDLNKLDLDAYICGSDQIWNSNITGSINSIYFCGFNNNKNVKRITYAASMGKNKYSNKQEEREFKNNLENLTHISVRESQLKEYTEKFTNKHVTQVLDPTLLLDKNKWRTISKKINIDGKYLILYSLQINENLLNVAMKISQKYNLKIVVIGNKSLRQKNDYIVLDNIGPEEFLGLFENCEFVVTNSFHGTCFSIINNKNFYTIPHSSAGSRMKSLLDGLGLKERLIHSEQDVDLEEIDYELVQLKLDEQIKNSLQFIENAMFGEYNEKTN